MSRPESPLRNNLTEDETIKKLKLMLIKEKRVNKENSKLISELNFDIETKSKENAQLINQIQRLSDNIGYLQENESSNLEEIEVLKSEILNLNNKSDEFQRLFIEKNETITKLNSHLELIYEKLQIPVFGKLDSQYSDLISELESRLAGQKEKIRLNKTIEEENNRLNEQFVYLSECNKKTLETIQIEKEKIVSDINAFKTNICRDINELLNGSQFISQKELLSDKDELNIISTSILSCVNDLFLQLNAQVESNSLLQDGIDKLVFKCNDLENIIANQNDKSKQKDLQSELEQKDEQIKRLEELIEDNRNISRALETERDQLQNDLVDLRQRHEEKEGYLIEEYREAKQNLESYRIFNDKESAYKVNEIERLRKIVGQYQQENSQDKLINDCRFCQEFELLAKTLKERFEIVDESFCHEEVIGKIIEKFETLQSLFDVQIELLQKNEVEYQIKVENIQNRMEYIEEKYMKTNEIELSENMQTNKRELSEIQKSNENLLNENNKFLEIFNKIEELINIDCKVDRNNIIGYIENSIDKTETLIKQINQYELEINNITENHNKLLNENQSLQMLKSINENLMQTIQGLELSNCNLEKETDLLKKSLLDKNDIIESVNNKLAGSQEYQDELIKQKNNLAETIDNVKEILNIDMNSPEKTVMGEIKTLIVLSKEMTETIDNVKEILNIDMNSPEKTVMGEIKTLIVLSKEMTETIDNSKLKLIEITDKYNRLLQENQSIVNESFDKENQTQTIEILQSKMKEMEDDLQNKNNFIESVKIDLVEIQKSQNVTVKEKDDLVDVIEKIKEILNINEISTESNIIDRLNFLKTSIDKYKLDIECINEKYNDSLNLNKSLSDKLVDFEADRNISKEFNELQLSSVNYKKEIELLNNEVEEKNNIIDNIKSDLLKYQESNFNEIIDKLVAVFNIDSNSDKSVIIDYVKKLLTQSEYMTNLINQYQSEIEISKEKYNNLSIENQSLYNKLEEIEKNSSGSDLINLEMAEFDKTLINLNNQLLTKTSQIDDMEIVLKSKEQLVNSFQEQLTEKENQNTLLDERCHKMKQLLVKSKRELADCKSEIEKLHTVNTSNSERIESLINQIEETKFHLSEALNEKEKLVDHHATILKRMETISKNKDIRLVDLKTQLDSTINNYQLLQKEFDSYKVKAQNALSTQQRPKPTFSNFMTQDPSDSKNVEDVDKKELKKLVTDLELVVKELKIDLQESEDKNFSLKNEIDNIRWENEKWIEKYKLSAKENSELAQKYQQAVKETQEIDKIQKSSFSNFIEKYEVEKDNLMKSYLNQIEINKSTFENQILNLEQKLSESENEKLKYQEEIWTCREQLKNLENKNTQSQLTTDYPLSTAKYQSWPNNFKTPFEHERQQGEGMETTSEQDDIDSLNNQHLSPGITFRTRNYNNVLIPLDKLLNSDDANNRSTEEQMSILSTQTQSYKKKIEHLTEILNDSEATVSRLTEQAKILKAEIRRLEQNQDRETKLTDESTHEYLKNVIMKFLDYETKVDERGQLVPVIVTLLSLNLLEKEKLTTFSKIIQFDRKSNSEGWSSYFNWTGIS